jgi:hypothetical protein
MKNGSEEKDCHCCGREGRFSILLVGDADHWYLPNQLSRDIAQEVWFCRFCMRVMEDSFRGVISGLQTAARKSPRA